MLSIDISQLGQLQNVFNCHSLSFSFVFFRFSGQVLNFLFRHSLSFSFFFSFLGFSGQVLNFILFYHSLSSSFLFFLFFWFSEQVLIFLKDFNDKNI